MTIFDWEDDGETEGFTANTASGIYINYALDSTTVPFRIPRTIIYSWEQDEWDEYDIIQAVNAYSTARLTRKTKQTNVYYLSNDLITNTVIFRDTTYDKIRFRGEIKK